jgi:hypothetical protein
VAPIAHVGPLPVEELCVSLLTGGAALLGGVRMWLADHREFRARGRRRRGRQD